MQLNNNLTLSQQIQLVVDKRNEALSSLTPLVTQANVWKNWIDSIVAFLEVYDSDWNGILWDSGEATASRWDEIRPKIDEFKSKIYNLIETDKENEGSLTEAYARASRSYLNLGSIGPWRRGKSEFIARMTQLDSWIVPRSKLDKCTGTTINIINDKYYSSSEDNEGKDNVALIYHYTVKEMCAILNQYFVYLDIDLQVTANTPAEFKAFCDSNRRKILHIERQVGKKGFKDTLDEYIQNVDEYYKDLDGEVLIISNLDTEQSKRVYRPCVSYRKTPDNIGTEVSYKVLATKKAIVYTHFKLLDTEVGKIQIVDTPGLGEKRIGVDEALEKALKKDLDIAIGLGKVAPAIDDEDLVQQFHEKLKIELKGRKPEDWLFYLFNVWSTAADIDKDVVTTVKRKILEDLRVPVSKENINYPGITIQEDHQAFIDCRNDFSLVGYNEDGTLDMSDDKGIEPFIKHVLEQMVTSIQGVDEAFYAKAKTDYEDVKTFHSELVSELNGLSLKNYNMFNIIDDQIVALHKELHSFQKINIVESIQNNIQGLQSEPTGMALLSSFVEDTSMDEKKLKGFGGDDSRSIQFIYERLKPIWEQSTNQLTEGQYDGNREFNVYSERKKDLFNKMKRDIANRIDEHDAIEKVRQRKEEFAQVFLSVGLMRYILPNSSPETFYEDICEELEKQETSYGNLINLFSKFNDFEVTIKDDIRALLDATLTSCLHDDDFGNDGFTTYESAVKSFIHSLFFIEQSIKDSVGESGSSISRVILNQSKKFNNECLDLASITDKMEMGQSPLRNELHVLYDEYKDKFFVDDESTVKQGIVDRWKRTIK